MKKSPASALNRRGAARRLPSTLITPTLLRGWPLPQPEPATGKDGRGTVLVIGGSVQVPGAVILAGVAALRVGSGKLQIATSRPVAPLVAVTVPEARVIGLGATPGGELHARSCRELRDDVGGCDALLIGPGMGESASPVATTIVRTCATVRPPPALVVDAGALAAFHGRSQLARGYHPPVIVTPHAGEMASLWGVSRQQVLADPAAIATLVAAALDVIVVLKGAHTHVATPAGLAFHNTAGNGGLATSGSGDALSGIIAGLCARGADPVQAAVWGVFLHAKAGDALSRHMGALGFLARELLAEIPPLLHRFDATGGSAGQHRRG